MKIKRVVLIPDGMAGVPLDALGGKTTLQAAHTPHMDALARRGRVGLTHNVPHGMEPGSDVAIMSILGYDPKQYYTGRGPLEAASMGVSVAPGQAAFRCNLLHVRDGSLIDYSAGHITTEESGEIIAAIQQELGSNTITFHHGVSFRNLMVLEADCQGLTTHAPHDHMDEPWEKYLPSGGPCADIIRDLILRSQDILAHHPVNEKRAVAGQRTANMIWPWSGGAIPAVTPFVEKFGVRGAAISAVDLVQGLGTVAGMSVIKVPGATGMVDTNYEGKVAAAIKALDTHDLVVVHLEGPDEAAHMGDMELKKTGIERFDSLIVKPIMDHLETLDAWRVLLLPDHPTPIPIRTHTSEPVPFLAAGADTAGGADSFSEQSAAGTGFVVKNGHELMGLFIKDTVF
jgi:2,3-bisphosphoglycerate-independent phosphoglycerate mutase